MSHRKDATTQGRLDVKLLSTDLLMYFFQHTMDLSRRRISDADRLRWFERLTHALEAAFRRGSSALST
jgi:hypothetical protein